MNRSSRSRGAPPSSPAAALPLDVALFAPGDRIGVAVSGGADSTALLRSLAERRAELGIVLSVIHVEHGLRGAAAARDARFVAELASSFHLPCETVAVDTRQFAAENRETIEEAARHLRYRAFQSLLAEGRADKVATAHTLDDQAETVLMKLLRGAWTEGISGIHPVLRLEENPSPAASSAPVCIRPMLHTTRQQVEAYLHAIGQPWCEDETNRSPEFTRNRVRHELMPLLRTFNPRIAHALAHVAANALAEEEHWRAELDRLLLQLLLPGKPARGGGRSVPTDGGRVVALEVARLQPLDRGLRRRVLRAAAESCGATLDYEATENLERMANPAALRAGKLELAGGVRVERTARELQFASVVPAATGAHQDNASAVYALPVPGQVDAPAFHATYTASLPQGAMSDPAEPACLRPWRPGDRVWLAHTRAPKKVKEVLERMRVHGPERAQWPVVVWRGQIVWMRGVTLQPIYDPASPTKQGASSQLFPLIQEAPWPSRRQGATQPDAPPLCIPAARIGVK